MAETPTSQKVWDDSDFTDEENIESRQSIANIIADMKKGPNRRAELLLQVIPMIQSKQWAAEWAKMAEHRKKSPVKNAQGEITQGLATLHFTHLNEAGMYSHVFLDKPGATKYLKMARDAAVNGELQVVMGPLESFRMNGIEYYPALFFERMTIDKFVKFVPVFSEIHAFAVLNMLTMGRVHVFFSRTNRDVFVEYFAKKTKPWAEPLYAEILSEYENKKIRAFVRDAAALGQSRALIARKLNLPRKVEEKVEAEVVVEEVKEKTNAEI
jgi:hypothetical protein